MQGLRGVGAGLVIRRVGGLEDIIPRDSYARPVIRRVGGLEELAALDSMLLAVIRRVGG